MGPSGPQTMTSKPISHWRGPQALEQPSPVLGGAAEGEAGAPVVHRRGGPPVTTSSGQELSTLELMPWWVDKLILSVPQKRI